MYLTLTELVQVLINGLILGVLIAVLIIAVKGLMS